jgi:two-component system sensor histidine kinase/response regulator
MAEYLGVRYRYQGNASVKITQSEGLPQMEQGVSLEEALSVMPKEWINKLNQAAAECSYDLVLGLIKEIPPEDTLLIAGLKDLANNFMFDKIMEISASKV